MNPYVTAAIKSSSALMMLTLILWLSANQFDESELRVIGSFGAFLGAGAFGEAFANRK